MPSPGGRVAPEGGRERNSGGNLQARTTSQTSTGVTTKTAPRWRSSHFRNHYVTARIPHQSWHRLWRHHDSFPPGEAMGAAASVVLLAVRSGHPGRGGPTILTVGNAVPGVPAAEGDNPGKKAPSFRTVLQIVKKRPIQAKLIPSPGGKVAPEGGRKRNSGRNLKVRTTRRPTKRLDLRRYIQ